MKKHRGTGRRARRGGAVGRILLRLFLLILVPAVFVFGGLVYYYSTGRFVETDNAYVKAPVTAVASEISGRILKVHVVENQRVKMGDLLLELEADEYRLMVREAEAGLMNVRHEIAARRAELSQALAEIQAVKERIRYLQIQYKREKRLSSRGVGRAAKMEEAQHLLRAAGQLQQAAREKRRRVLARLGGDPKMQTAAHPLFLEADARVKRAKLNLSRTRIHAPADGIIAKMTFEVGEFVEDAKPLFALVNTGEAWVEANLKETELTHIKPGQRATFVADTYPDISWHGRVIGISPATGAEFALLPPQNASGNWVKIVQRLPVRLLIDDVNKAGKPRLRAGMSVRVSIDTEREREVPAIFSKVVAMTKNVVGRGSRK